MGKNQIITVTKAGLFSGVNESTFAPNKSLTRGQTAIVLNSLAYDEKATTGPSYKDVGASSPIANDIAWVTENKIMSGKMLQPLLQINQLQGKNLL